MTPDSFRCHCILSRPDTALAAGDDSLISRGSLPGSAPVSRGSLPGSAPVSRGSLQALHQSAGVTAGPAPVSRGHCRPCTSHQMGHCRLWPPGHSLHQSEKSRGTNRLKPTASSRPSPLHATQNHPTVRGGGEVGGLVSGGVGWESVCVLVST